MATHRAGEPQRPATLQGLCFARAPTMASCSGCRLRRPIVSIRSRRLRHAPRPCRCVGSSRHRRAHPAANRRETLRLNLPNLSHIGRYLVPSYTCSRREKGIKEPPTANRFAVIATIRNRAAPQLRERCKDVGRVGWVSCQTRAKAALAAPADCIRRRTCFQSALAPRSSGGRLARLETYQVIYPGRSARGQSADYFNGTWRTDGWRIRERGGKKAPRTASEMDHYAVDECGCRTETRRN